MNKPQHIYLGIGTNVGDRIQNIHEAKKRCLEKGIEILRTASIYESEPLGFESDLQFYNTVFEVNAKLSPLELLNELKTIETEMGRVAKSGDEYENRIIDMDILLYYSEVLHNLTLDIPHREISNRKFVLCPLNELIPRDLHPELLVAIETLLNTTIDKSSPFIVHNPLLINE